MVLDAKYSIQLIFIEEARFHTSRPNTNFKSGK